jgi:hypothetical protein
MHQQLWGYKVEKNLYVGVREQKKFEYRLSRRSGVSNQVGAKLSAPVLAETEARPTSSKMGT